MNACSTMVSRASHAPSVLDSRPDLKDMRLLFVALMKMLRQSLKYEDLQGTTRDSTDGALCMSSLL